MPPKKEKKTKRNKRYGKYQKKSKKYYGNSLSYPISSKTLGIPTTQVVRMRYATDVQLVLGLPGLIGYHYFRANSIYDPDYTATGHTMAGYNNMFALYNHYLVLGSKITVTWSNGAGETAADVPCRVGTFIDADASIAATNYYELLENGKGTSKVIATGNANLHQTTKTTAIYSPKKFFNIQDPKDLRESLGSQFGANPSEGAFFAVWAQPIGSYTANLTANVIIDMVVSFGEPKTI